MKACKTPIFLLLAVIAGVQVHADEAKYHNWETRIECENLHAKFTASCKKGKTDADIICSPHQILSFYTDQAALLNTSEMPIFPEKAKERYKKANAVIAIAPYDWACFSIDGADYVKIYSTNMTNAAYSEIVNVFSADGKLIARDSPISSKILEQELKNPAAKPHPIYGSFNAQD